MLKIRVMGTVKELQEFRLFIERAAGYKPESISDIYRNKGTDRYFRLYMNLSRECKEDTRNAK